MYLSRMAFSTKPALSSQSFLNQERYYGDGDKYLKNPAAGQKEFDLPDHLYKPVNDDFTRMSAPKIDPKKYLRDYGIHYENLIEPQSAYFKVNHNGMIFHVFDASRIPLGRMAIKAAKFLMGKHKPNYDPKKMLENGDRIIVVNGGNIKVTGRKRTQWIFRHHTQYSGGLKEIVFEDLMERDCEQLVKRVIRGMMPHNRTRKFLLDRIVVHKGQYHPHEAQGIPQFINQPLPDPNEMLHLVDKDNINDYKIVYESDPNMDVEEFKGVERDIDENVTYPYPHYKKDFYRDPRNKRVDKKFNQYKRKVLQKLNTRYRQ